MAGPPTEAPPEANLAAIYPDWAAWERGADELAAAVERFASLRDTEWRSPADLLGALRAKDEVHRRAAAVDGYLGLRLALDRSDSEALAHRPRMSAIAERWEGGASVWFAPRLQALGRDRLEAWIGATPALAPYRWLLRRATAGTPRPLTERELELLSLVDLERSSAEEVYAALNVTEAPRIQVELPSGRRLDLGPALARNLAAEIADSADRHAAHRAWLEALAAHASTNAALLAGIIRRERFAATQRGFPNPLTASFAEEGVAASVVTGMLAAARRGAPAVAHWHAARRARLAIARYGVADIRAPLPGMRSTVSWAEARDDLLSALAPLGPEVLSVARRAFDERWMDAVERPRKEVVGFSTFVYGEHPYLSIVFRGTPTDTTRLAHELGHVVHHQIAFASQPFAVARPSVLVGETVAAVNELLLARRLSARARTAAEQVATLDFEAQLVHRNFVDTALDADFEIAAHGEPGEPGAKRLADLFRERLIAFHGGALELEERDGDGWLEVPHFFNARFTMGRYGLSFAAAARLLEGLLDPDAGRAAQARARYLALLRAGGSEAPLDLLKSAGADLEDPETVAAVPRRLEALARGIEPKQ